jgi:hypothetical protein
VLETVHHLQRTATTLVPSPRFDEMADFGGRALAAGRDIDWRGSALLGTATLSKRAVPKKYAEKICLTNASLLADSPAGF